MNAATREKDIQWIKQQMNGFDVEMTERDDLAMIAVQGPNARARVLSVLSEEEARQASELTPFFGADMNTVFIARTGYTGEDGFEIMLPSENAPALWDELLKVGVKPIGLGARDTLRLEAGMNLYGADMDETISPLQAGMGWTIAWEPADREFIGRKALEKEKSAGSKYRLVGLVLEDKGVLRSHQKVITNQGAGEITSGTFSPTLGYSIALARVPVDAGESCEVEMRGKKLTAAIVKPPFVRNGKALV